MVFDRDILAAIGQPKDQDDLQAAFATLQTWVPRLRALIAAQSEDATDISTLQTDLDTAEAVITTLQATIIASGQIQFPATQNPSSGANVLDDYEEGDWTPIDSSGAALAFTVAEGHYVKIGQFVLASAFVQYPVTANGAAASVGGAPFTSQNRTNNTNAGAVGYSNSGLALGAMLANNGTTTTFANFATGVNATNVQLTATTLIFSLIYRAAA